MITTRAPDGANNVIHIMYDQPDKAIFSHDGCFGLLSPSSNMSRSFKVYNTLLWPAYNCICIFNCDACQIQTRFSSLLSLRGFSVVLADPKKLDLSSQWLSPADGASRNSSRVTPLLIIIQEQVTNFAGIQSAIYRCLWAKVFENEIFQRFKLLHPYSYRNQT